MFWFDKDIGNRSQEAYDVVLDGCRDARPTLRIHVSVHLKPHAEFGEIDAGLDREAGPRQDRSGVMGIIIVEIHSGGVELAARADAVAGAMDEMLTEAFLRDAIPRQPIELPTLDALSALPSVREMPNDGITC